jgi:hypothetical protein
MNHRSDRTEHVVLRSTADTIRVAEPSAANRFNPSTENRAKISDMSSIGVPELQIANLFGITVKKLRKTCKNELTSAVAESNRQVLRVLHDMAIKGNATAAIFWAKTRCGFREAPAEPKIARKPVIATAQVPEMTFYVNDGEPNH